MTLLCLSKNLKDDILTLIQANRKKDSFYCDTFDLIITLLQKKPVLLVEGKTFVMLRLNPDEEHFNNFHAIKGTCQHWP